MKKIVLMLLVLLLTSCQNANEVQDNLVNIVSIEGMEIDFQPLENGPSNLYVNYKDILYLAVQGTTTWSYDQGNGETMTINSCSSGPSDLVNYQIDPIIVKGGEGISLEFEDLPNQYKVVVMHSNGDREAAVYKDNKIIIPTDRDSIIYEVQAFYAEGNVYYAFEIEII